MERTPSRASRRAVLISCILVSPTFGTVLTYNGPGGPQNWNTPGAWSGTPANATQWPDSASEDVVVNNAAAQLNINANYVVGRLDLSAGALTGSGTITTSGRFAFAGGALAGTGTIQANAGFDITGSAGVVVLNGRSIATLADSAWTSGSLRVDSDTSIANAFVGATLTLGHVSVDPTSAGTLSLFNGGTLLYNTPQTTILARSHAENAGLTRVLQGTIAFESGINFDDIDVSGGATFRVDGDYQLHGAASPAGSVLSGSGATSTFSVASGATLTVSNAAGSVCQTQVRDLVVDNLGTILFSAEDVLTTTGSGAIHNRRDGSTAGLLLFTQAGGLNTAAGSPTGPGVGLINDGILRVASGAGTVVSYMPITNTASGQIQIRGGTLDVHADASLAGAIDIDAGASLQLASSSPATVTAATTVDGTLVVRNGNYVFDAGSSLGGTGTLRASGPDAARTGVLQIDGAVVSGTLAVDVRNFGVVTASDATFSDVSVESFGTFQAGPSVDVASLHSVGTLTVDAGGAVAADVIDVSGQTVSSGLLRSRSTFNNAGQITVNAAGSLAAAGSFTNNGDLVLAAGASAAASLSAPDLDNNGTLYGEGTVAVASTTSRGAIAPGVAADVGIGTIRFDGDLSLEASHLLRMQVDALNLSADNLAVTGGVLMDGYLDYVQILGDARGLSPSQQFTIVQADALAGAFASDAFVDGRIEAYDDLFNIGSFKVVVDEADARVYLTDFALVPEPGTLLALGWIGLLATRRARTA